MIHAKINQTSLNYAGKIIKDYTTITLYFAEQKTGSCSFMKLNVYPNQVQFSSVFLKLINIYIVNKTLVIISLQYFHTEKSET